MGLRQVEITFDNGGNPTIHVKGVNGPGCKALTKDLEDAFGSKKTETLTPEYRLADTTTQRQAQSR